MKSIASLAVTTLLAVSLSACALTNPFTRGDQLAQAAMPGQMEPVHAAVIAHDQALFRVTSNGCTAKADLTPVVRQTRNEAVITLRRIKEDRCQQPIADGLEVSWTFEELGLASGARVSVENPYQLPRT
ncbi:hypothetical protein [Brevundimonas sp.]